MKNMGSLSKIMGMIPGLGKMKIPKDMLDVQEKNLEKWKFIMDSCSKKELEDPDSISASHVARIAKGSGTDEDDVRQMLKQFKQSKKMMKMMKGGNVRGNKRMKEMMKQFGGNLPNI